VTSCHTIMQLSDTHLCADKNESLQDVATWETLTNVLSHSTSKFPHADLYVVTGDLSHDGSARSYRNMKDLFADVEKTFYVIPGNHDDLQKILSVLLSENTRLKRYIDLGAWRIVFVNSQVQGEEFGFVKSPEIRNIRKKRGSDGQNILVCMHHPPVALGSHWIDKSRLRNAMELINAIEETAGTKVLVWGHAHQEYAATRNGLIMLGAPSTCAQFKPGTDGFELDHIAPGYRAIRLYDNGTVESEVVRVDQREGIKEA